MQTYNTAQTLHIAYFFFDFNDPAKQTVEGLLRSLVFQLAASVEPVPKILQTLYARHHEDRGCPTQPTLKEWTSVFQELLRSRAPFYIVIDALDECREEELLVDTVKSLIVQSRDTTRWLLT